MRRFAAPILLALAAVLVHVDPGWGAWLEYRREALADWELWRLITGHWVHGSISHLIWDTLAFAALGCGLNAISPRAFRNAVLGSAATISVFLYVHGESWELYRGLSGIDTALFVALAGVLAVDGGRIERMLFLPALVAVGGKIAWEASTGSALFAGEIPGHAVVPLAHAVGAAVGLLVVGDRLGDRLRPYGDSTASTERAAA